MSLPRNTAVPLRPAATAGTRSPLRRRAVMVGNLLAGSGLFFFAACSEGVTAPSAPAARAASERRVPIAAAPSGDGFARAIATPGLGLTVGTKGDTLVESFTWQPAEGLVVQSTRGHQVVMPQGAICDPATSGYGTGTWDKSCKIAKASIRFTMRSWTAKDGSAQITFAPDVRFSPAQTVLLKVARPASLAATSTPGPIRWCTAAMTGCVDESLTDKSAGTSFDPLAATAWRRIKHFSGFNTGFGRDSTTRLQ